MLVLGQVWAAQNRIDDAIAKFQSVLRMDNVSDNYRQIASTLLAQHS
jgi:hypothetical protein